MSVTLAHRGAGARISVLNAVRDVIVQIKPLAAFVAITSLWSGLHNLEAANPPADPGDGRKVLARTDSVPARYVGLIYFDDPRPPADRPSKKGRIRSGTAFLIGERHILTCAHCITNHPGILKELGDKPYPDDFPEKAYFAPGHHGEVQTPGDAPANAASQPYGRYEIVGVSAIYRQYAATPLDPKRGANPISMYDVVVLELDRSTKPLVGGHFQLNDARLTADGTGEISELNLNGYDADRSPTAVLPNGHERKALWQMTRMGTIEVSFKNASRSKNHLANMTCKAYAGGSGGPIWALQDGTPTVFGITVLTDNDRKNEAVGLFFSPQHIDFIKAGLGTK